MILMLALAMAMQAAPAPAAELEPDIEVIGRRLAALSVIVSRDSQGRLSCNLSQSSGNARLDSQLCRTAAKCVGKGAVDRATVSACIDRRKPALLQEVRRTLRGAA